MNSISRAQLSRERCRDCPACFAGLCGSTNVSELAQLSQNKRPRRVYAPHSYLYRQGDQPDEYYMILHGWLALRVTLETGDHHTVDFALPGSFLGFYPDFGLGLGHSAECLTTVVACALPRAVVERLMMGNPTLVGRLLQIGACHEARAHEHIVNISARGARERVAHLLLELFYRFHQRLPTEAGETANLPLTLEQIGEAVGLTAIHVNRMLRTLREQNVIRFFRRELVVLNPKTFLSAAGWDAQTMGPDESWPVVARVGTA